VSLLVIAMIAAPASAEDWAPGATIPQAILADVTPDGFDAAAALVPTLVPSRIDVPDTTGDRLGIDYGVVGAWVDIDVTDAALTPGHGVLNLDASMSISVNSAWDTFDLYAHGGWIPDQDCAAHVEAFPVALQSSIALSVVTDGRGVRRVDASVGTIDLQNGLTEDHIQLSDCGLATIEGVLDNIGLSLVGLILDPLEGELDDAVAELGPELESTIEDALQSASVRESVDVNGGTLDLALSPSSVQVTPEGMRVTMEGSAGADAAACVAAYDPGGSPKSTGGPPSLGSAPSGVPTPFHVGVSVSDDFTNEALYAVWRSGALCVSLDADAGLPLDTTLLHRLTGDALAPIFPESAPVGVRLAPRKPPTSAFGAGHDVDVALRETGVEFIADLDGRKARVLTVDLDGPVGVDLAFDGATGQLDAAVDLDAESLTPSVSYNEFAPGKDDTIVAAFRGTFGTLLDTVVGGVLEGLGTSLPSFEGIGVQAIRAGSTAEWLGVYAFVGEVDYVNADGGCGSCAGGCAQGPAGAMPHPGLVLLGVLVLRRRRDG
jgi:hypothetical protein